MPSREANATEPTGLEVQPSGLTSNEVARRALAASASVQQKRAELDAANAKIRQTTIQFFPQLTLKASYTRLSPVSAGFGNGALVGAQHEGTLSTGPCPTGGGTCVLDSAGTPVGARAVAFEFPQNNYALSASLSVPLSDYVFRLTHAAAASSASREAAERALEAEKLEVENTARILYYNWLRANGQVFITRKALERNQARLADARAAQEVGTISRADLYRVEALVANTELAVTQAMALHSLANTELAIVMEDKTTPTYRIGQSVEIPAPVTTDERAGRQLVAQAMRTRLELKAIDATNRSLTRGADAIRAGALPKIDGFGDVTYANPNPRIFPQAQEWNATWAVGASATWNIDNLFMNNASADEVEANARATRARRRALEAAITQQVVAALLDVAKGQAALQANETALKAAEESYRVRTDLFRAGQATTSDLIEAESELLTAKLAAINARIDLMIATLELRHATGGDIAKR